MLPVAGMAEEIGYRSHSAFSHAFKRTFGRTPRMAPGKLR
ncbi:AraC family transcriptional regulator [Devosia sp. BK]|jgi:AraC-like DNA-binding protein|nr:AraC family transcriptional regulator [Devosia sp. BK]MDV3252658.1 AraC family transcriptional regulator [Devosia sp. BK]